MLNQTLSSTRSTDRRTTPEPEVTRDELRLVHRILAEAPVTSRPRNRLALTLGLDRMGNGLTRQETFEPHSGQEHYGDGQQLYCDREEGRRAPAPAARRKGQAVASPTRLGRAFKISPVRLFDWPGEETIANCFRISSSSCPPLTLWIELMRSLSSQAEP